MRNRTLRVAVLATALAAVPALAGTFKNARERGVPDTYIVVLKDGVARKARGPLHDLPTVAEAAQSLGRGHGGKVQEVWEDALHGFVIRMPEARARKLAEDPRVVSVEQSFELSAPVGDCYEQGPWQDTRPLPSSSVSPQPINCSNPDPTIDTDSDPGDTDPTPLCKDNWGLDRIDQTSFVRNGVYNFVDTSSVHIYVMDTGIRWSHREFQDASGVSRVSGGVDARANPVVPGNSTNTDDCHAHGTHVAGIAAGRTFGVAKNARLHPVRVRGCATDPPVTVESWIRGLNWIVDEVVQKRVIHGVWPSVINWSGGNGENPLESETLVTAVQNVVANNITLVQAAGNQSPPWNLSLPAAQRDACQNSFGGLVPNVIVAGGMDHNEGRWARRTGVEPDDLWALTEQGSNGGACVDIWAPAAYVISSNFSADDLACGLTGTSMAAPHVSGAVAIYLQSNPSATPAQVEAALRSRGTWGSLQTSTASKNFIGLTSDNVVLRSDTQSTGDTAPIAALTMTCPGRQCNFDALASTDNVAITSYAWAFGDDTTASGPTVQHTFPPDFQGFTVLKVTDNTGKTDHLQQYISVNSNAPPVASFSHSCTGRTCTFDSSASSDDQSVVSRTWTFGDGSTGSGTSPSYTYATDGAFVVTLTVADSAGQTGKDEHTVAANMMPPTDTVATATGANVTITWVPSPGADGYDVERKVSSAGWQLAQIVNGGTISSINDVPVSASGVVLYRVIARFGTSLSEPSNNDVAYVGTFTNNPVVALSTTVKAEHVTEMRRAVNGLLDIAAQAPAFTNAELDPNLVRGQTIDDANFLPLMQKLNDVRSALGLPIIGFQHVPAPSALIRKTQIEDLRSGVQ